MSKKRKHTPRGAASTSVARQKTAKKNSPDGVVTGPEYPTEEIKWWREAIEGLLVAIVLALLIRGYEAEAFVIPTGSMAPTLRGMHKDVKCEQCAYEYAAGASQDSEVAHGRVVLTVCPMCAFPQTIEYTEGRDASFSGDRILVNKFAYDPMGKPERFDVIVFKNPNDAKQNYIKRLCGLPGETIKLLRGDIYFRRDNDPEPAFEIARKPPRKLRAMLQPVHDTKYISKKLDELGLPPRWQADGGSAAWTTPDRHRTFDVQSSPNDNWIRYRHIVPTLGDWAAIHDGKDPDFKNARGELISDHYAYNSYLNANANFNSGGPLGFGDQTFGFWDRSTGKNWVGDIALEANVDVKSDAGELTLQLVEAGWRFDCRFDVSTGKATVSMRDQNGQAKPFDGGPTVTAETAVQGSGSYRLLFSNVDSELRLWVNNKLIEFDKPATYSRSKDVIKTEMDLRPYYGGPDDLGDLAPAGLAGKNLDAHVERLRIHRDKYYVAVKGGTAHQDPTAGDYIGGIDSENIRTMFRSPDSWDTLPIFEQTQSAEFVLKDSDDDSKDQFFPMGDNSPQSHDARVWNAHANYVERQFLIGEAVLIYYPHPWAAKLPGNPGTRGENFRSLQLLFYPKFSRMGLIR